MWEDEVKRNDVVLFEGKDYQILGVEEEIHTPDVFGISQSVTKGIELDCSSTYEINGHQIYLKDMMITTDEMLPFMNEVKFLSIEADKEPGRVLYKNIFEEINYTGGLLIGCDYFDHYYNKYDLTYFLYGKLYELIFEDGKLITTIDHSKAMLRIRKNLDLGLRNLDQDKDRKCIKHFLKKSFVGDYIPPGRKLRRKLKNITQYLDKIKIRTPFT